MEGPFDNRAESISVGLSLNFCGLNQIAFKGESMTEKNDRYSTHRPLYTCFWWLLPISMTLIRGFEADRGGRKCRQEHGVEQLAL
jgi:hypothetical protein